MTYKSEIMMALSLIITVASSLLVAFFFIFPPPPPISTTGNDDSVTPTVVKAGETISVTRSLRSISEAPVGVVRTMVKGDCAKSCEVIDLFHGSFSLKVGEHMRVKRDHVIPLRAEPGEWRLVFWITWQDRLGRTLKTKLPELTIEVTE